MTGLETLLLFALPIVALFWLMSRQRRQQKDTMALQKTIQEGQDVMTASGMYGTIRSIDGDIVLIESMPGQLSRWDRRAVVKVVTQMAEDGTDSPPQDPADPTHPTGA